MQLPWFLAISTTTTHFSLQLLKEFAQTTRGAKFSGKSYNKTTKDQYFPPILHSPHWFSIEQKIQCKMCLLVYKTLHSNQPSTADLSPLLAHLSC